MKRSSRAREISISIGLSLLLVALSLSPALPKALNPGGSVIAFDESIDTFAGSDCITPKTVWNLGQLACATATGAPEDRRIAWVAPDGTIADVTGFFTGTLTDTYAITSGSDPLAQVGTWTVQTIDPSGGTFAVAKFIVKDPANAKADLSLANFGTTQTSAGNNISYRIELTNLGPDDAQAVTVVSSVPANTTFVSETQDSGPAFTCTAPSTGSGSGTISCSIATLAPEATAVFTLVFNVNSGTPNGTVISNTASVSMSGTTGDGHTANNSASASTTVVSATSGCTVGCPSAAPVSTSGCSAVVTYGAPTTSGSCGASEEGGGGVVCSPPSGSVFPVGSTAISCTAPTGDSCSFSAIVQSSASGTLGISCSPDVSVNSDSVSAGSATVSYASPAATGNCVTVSCVPPSGSAFAVGTTVVTCTATDSSGSTPCSFNVTVVNANPGVCTLTCSDDVTQNAAAGQCSAAVNYTAPATSGTCGTVTCIPPSGSTFPGGSTIVTCTSTEGPSCDFTVTVVATAAPTITTCASNKTIEITANCAAVIPNLVTEVVTTGCNVTVTQSPVFGTVVGAGTYTVTITAENSAGEATCTASVTVHSLSENFTGFFSPVNNPPAVNVVNAGRAIPVKFSLNGNKGLDIFATGYPVSGVIECDASAPPVEVVETVTAGSSSLNYDAGSDRYTYIWKTESSWAGTCRQLILKFKDGCIQVANFSFR